MADWFTQNAPPAQGGDWFAKNAPPQGESKPSLTDEFLSHSPVGMVQQLADAIRDPKHAIAGILAAPAQNAKLFDKAKDAFGNGDYTGAAAHFLNYLVPGGGALDDAGEDFQKGDSARGAAKTLGIASTMLAGAKAPEIMAKTGDTVDAVKALPQTVPDAVLKVGAKIKDHVMSKGISATTGIPSPVVRLVMDAMRGEKPALPVASTPAAAPVTPPPTPQLAPEPPAIIPAQGYATRPDAIPSQNGVLPALDRSQFFRPLPNERTGMPAPAPVEVSPTPVAAPAPELSLLEKGRAAFEAQKQAPLESDVPATTADTDIEAQLQASIDAVKARKVKGEPGPVEAAANAEKSAQLKAEAKQVSASLEEKARARKALKIGRWLSDGGITGDDIGMMDSSHWKMVAEGAGVPHPSAQTIQMVKDMMSMGAN